MKSHEKNLSVVGLLSLTLAMGMFWMSCDRDDDDDDIDDEVGQACTSAQECYPGIAPEDIAGDVVCMDRVEGGYCTHHCMADEDCCSVEGECETGIPQVCGPFESTGEQFCFLSCEDQADADNYCQLYAHRSFICRSTGGGSENRKVCVPEG